jgi:Trk K+ transport system NAD-binding subunit
VKSIGLILSYLAGSGRKQNLRLVGGMVAIFVALVALYSVIFHVLMAREGREHSWATGVYWTMTTMSTLGFGDITFESDAGRIFSVVVLVSGAMFILVLLPFMFIQFLFLPWVAWREANRAPRRLPEDTEGHLVLVGRGPVTDGVIRRADDAGVPYVLLEPDPQTALALHDEGVRVMIGEVDDPATYRAARVGSAALVAATLADTTNTNVAFTVREITDHVPIVATASAEASVDILGLAGCDDVLQLGEELGQAVARRVLSRDGHSQVIGELGPLLVAEAQALHPEVVDRSLAESRIRPRTGVHVAGVWDRGRYAAAGPATRPGRGEVLVLVGSEQALARYDAELGVPVRADDRVVVIGGGRVGRAASRMLDGAGVPHRIIEKRPERVRDPARYVVGDAADHEVLAAAGLPEASAVLVTTHDDDVNVYLTIYCRRLRPDVQIIARANLERNVATLHRAGADSVLSYASLGASWIWNAVGDNDTVVLAEGLEVFRVPVPRDLAGRPLRDSRIREETGATVVAVVGDDGALRTDPDVHAPLEAGTNLVLIADADAQQRFLSRHPLPTERASGRRAPLAPPATART